jgi:hypothetical protein
VTVDVYIIGAGRPGLRVAPVQGVADIPTGDDVVTLDGRQFVVERRHLHYSTFPDVDVGHGHEELGQALVCISCDLVVTPMSGQHVERAQALTESSGDVQSSGGVAPAHLHVVCDRR